MLTAFKFWFVKQLADIAFDALVTIGVVALFALMAWWNNRK